MKQRKCYLKGTDNTKQCLTLGTEAIQKCASTNPPKESSTVLKPNVDAGEE